MNDKDFIEQLKQVSPIIEVARELGLNVPQNGTMPCLFPEEHGRGDQNPSMRFDSQRNNVHCWGCSKVLWDVVDLVRHLRACSRREALTWLAERAGMHMPASSASTPRSDDNNPNASQYYDILTAFTKEAERRIENGGIQYFRSRGISDEVIEKQHLGFVDDYNAVVEAVSGEYPSTFPKDSGLTAFYTYGVQRIPFVVFPYLGVVSEQRQGGTAGKRYKCVFLKARQTTDSAPGLPKYLATKSTIPFLYNARVLDLEDEVFVAEGEIDTLTLLTHGYPAVGVPGANNFKKEWATRFADKVVNLVLDADRAGRRGALDISQMLTGIAKCIRRIDLARGMDVNSFFNTGGVK